MCKNIPNLPNCKEQLNFKCPNNTLKIENCSSKLSVIQASNVDFFFPLSEVITNFNFLHLEYLSNRYMILFFINLVIFKHVWCPVLTRVGAYRSTGGGDVPGKPLKNILNHISSPRKFAFESTPMLSKVWVTRCKEHKFPSVQRWLNKPWFIHTESNATLEHHEIQLDVPIKRRPRHLAKWKGKLPKRVLPL